LIECATRAPVALKYSRALLISDWTARQASVPFSHAVALLYDSYSLAKAGIRINFSRVRLNSLSTSTSFSNSPKMKVTAPLKNWPVAARKAAKGLIGSSTMTGTENKARDGYGGSDLIQSLNLLSAICLAIQSAIGLASVINIASTNR